jgi:hypothetical protein
MLDTIPKSVRYVKNGAGGQWWTTAKANGQVHLGWRNVPTASCGLPICRRLKP